MYCYGVLIYSFVLSLKYINYFIKLSHCYITTEIMYNLPSKLSSLVLDLHVYLLTS